MIRQKKVCGWVELSAGGMACAEMFRTLFDGTRASSE